VGLPDGFQGSSEVGHLNMGAGRIVLQELKRIDDGLASGQLFEKPKWQDLAAAWRNNGSSLHLFGLLQDEGVHAHQEHLFKIIRRARADYPDGEIICHPFLDGRDTPPRSSMEYIAKLKVVLDEVGNARVGTCMGRYYAMDRGQQWQLTDRAYACIVDAEGRQAADIEDAVQQSYANDKTPDGNEMGDEYIYPYVIDGYDGMRDGDVVMHTNYRQDRAIQLTLAFTADDYPGQRGRRPQITYLGLTQYFDEFEDFLLGAGDGGDVNMDNLVGEVIGRAGLKQLRIAETQKFRHVTSFFNGKKTTPYPGEDQVEVKGRFDPALFGDHPEMDAYTVTDRVLGILAEEPEEYDFIVINFANCDMVGHTGIFAAAKRAAEVVDECVGKVTDRILELDGHVLLTADHGNAEQMVDYQTDMTKTSHTLNPVYCSYIANDAAGKHLIAHGKLSDLGLTAVKLLGLEAPSEMTADCLIDGV
jgi:2,3-bisphosphoglycerate-independent phosphoglycerate mutase